MRLTALEIKGFKSFADKTVIRFNENITGVVGPNGSGKSNVVDAIRWVIGEQRTSNLRSEKMSNLIFNGTRKRKAAGRAEVTLSFENTRNLLPTEFSHVTITRILHRSGDSEYRINDVPCRLKDITNLFLDTGISSDSYAIIELKMIDEILHDRDNSRRKLFEQAAGISKYKQRKKETLSKLNSTDADLARVEDLLFEIEGQLKSLESQARKTQRFYKLKEEYKELSVELAKHYLAGYQQSFDAIENRRKQEHNRKLEIEVRVRELEAKLEKSKADIIAQEKHLSGRQKELNEIMEQIHAAENQKTTASQQLSFAKEKQESLTRRLKQTNDQIEHYQNKLKELATRKTDQAALVKATKEQLDALEQKLSSSREQNTVAKNELEAINAVRQEMERQLYDMEKRIGILRSQKESYERSIEQNIAENKDRENSLTAVKQEAEELQKEIAQIQANIEKLTADEEKLQREIVQTQQTLEDTRNKAAQENRMLDSKQNEYNLNKSLVENLEGFPESIKFLKKKDEQVSALPLLSDIIYCKEQYRVAIEGYLEPFLNYLVADSFEQADHAVNLLSDSSKGRAHFFLLPDMEGYKAGDTHIVPNATPATAVIETDAKYRKLAAFLLEDVYLVPDSLFKDTAAMDELLTDRSITVLSESGKYVRGKYSLSGGSVGLFEGMRIGRSKTLEKLKKEIEDLQKQRKKTDGSIASLQQTTEKLKESTKQSEIQAQKQLLNQKQNQLTSLNTKVENFQQFVAQYQKRNEEIRAKLQTVEDELKELDGKSSAMLKEKQAEDAKHVDILTRYNTSGESLSGVSAEYNEKNILFHQQQNQLSSYEQEINYNNNRLREANEAVTNDGQEQKEVVQKEEASSKQLQQAEESLSKLYEQKEEFQKGLSGVEEAYYEAKEGIQKQEEVIRKYQKEEAQVLEKLSEIKDQTNELKLELNGLKERLSVEFKIDINEILDKKPEEGTSREEVQAKVERIRNRVENFGEINPMAVEAFEEMEKRHGFITEQREDLLKAKDLLQTTMNEIEETAREKFMEAFVKVRENFQMTFRSLFTADDQCDLVLTVPENPLESGIDIIAQPKGKRPLVIDQLSGGEKTLTSLALLFSLYLLKPAPFCILDEVDAPLDDTNIGKFNKAIREFSKESQFILVTHNKSTMAATDVMYGVAMQEQGVSKVVPVDFRAKEYKEAEEVVAG